MYIQCEFFGQSMNFSSISLYLCTGMPRQNTHNFKRETHGFQRWIQEKNTKQLSV